MIKITYNTKSNELMVSTDCNSDYDQLSIDLVKKRISAVDEPVEDICTRVLNKNEQLVLVKYLMDDLKQQLQKKE